MELHMTSRYTPTLWRLCIAMAIVVATAFTQQPAPMRRTMVFTGKSGYFHKPAQDFWLLRRMARQEPVPGVLMQKQGTHGEELP
jgi:hypothetical protein